LLVANGIRLLAPLHDAVLIEAPVHLIEEHTELTRQILGRASADILAVSVRPV